MDIKELRDKIKSGELMWDKKGNLRVASRPGQIIKSKPVKIKKEDRISPFQFLVKQQLGLNCIMEYKFHSKRKWRFDYCIPEHKIAIEVEGGLFSRGRHVRGYGYVKDMEKYNAATELGWKLIRVQPKDLLTIKTTELIKNMLTLP